jgi:octanoyl-[GcvH]:protein N-octanoyltransferase
LQQFTPKLTSSQLTVDEVPLYETNLQRIIDRNNKALGLEQ